MKRLLGLVMIVMAGFAVNASAQNSDQVSDQGTVVYDPSTDQAIKIPGNCTGSPYTSVGYKGDVQVGGKASPSENSTSVTGG